MCQRLCLICIHKCDGATHAVFYIQFPGKEKSVSLKQVHLNYTALTDLLSAPANLQSMTKVSYENQLPL